MTPQFHIGQTVYLQPSAFASNAAGMYEIRAVLPEEEGRQWNTQRTDNPSINTKVPHAAGNLTSSLGIGVACVDNPARSTLTVERD
jgi:hypothetical protein